MKNENIFNRRTILQIVIGSILGIAAIYLAFRGVSVSQLWKTLGQANPWLTLVALLIALLNVAVFTLRWWVMLLLDWRLRKYLAMLAGVYLGQMFNILLPARLGELARIYFVGERVRVSKSKLLGTVVIEKVADLVAFGVGVLLLLLMISLPSWVFEPGQLLIAMAVASLLGVVVIMLWGQKLLNWLRPWLEKLLGRWGQRLAGMFEQALSGLDSLRSWRRQAAIWACSFLVVILSTLTNYFLLLALDIQAPFSAALFVLVVLQVGSAPPSAPGKLGIYHYLAVIALSVFAVEKDLALAYGVLLYVVALLSKVIIGVFVLFLTRWQIPEIAAKP
ncbi:MAG: lysylphosphatidylglycerol synthase transmembrane domain-containing protein [Chloroflexota bacterium]|nr:lysylphosphatidylglycerol synthase transmembrane domain-containing protein [Chloroflexota bacterium]